MLTYFRYHIRLLFTGTGRVTPWWKRDPKPTRQIHHARWIVLFPQLFQLLEITTVKILHTRGLRQRRANEVREPFRRLALCVDLVPDHLQSRLHSSDPVVVVPLTLPGEVDDDRAVGLVFYVRPGRGSRLVKHALGKRPHANTGTRAPVFFHIFGGFLEYSGHTIRTDRESGCGIRLRLIVFRVLR